jgi:hypothetical protein
MDYLLSGGGLGGSQQARIFDAVARMARRQERGSLIHRLLGARWAGPIGAAVAVAAVCLVVGTWKRPDPASFRRKGADTTEATAAIDVECLRATLGACPRGSIVAFSIGGADPGRFLTAYLTSSKAKPPIWLLLNEPTAARAAGGGDLLARGARLPDALDGGSYTMEVLVTNRPQLREQALDSPAAETVARARFTVTVPQ